MWRVIEQYSSLVMLLLFTVVSLSRVDAAGRAFPIDSENYIEEQFSRINRRLVRRILCLHSLLYLRVQGEPN